MFSYYANSSDTEGKNLSYVDLAESRGNKIHVQFVIQETRVIQSHENILNKYTKSGVYVRSGEEAAPPLGIAGLRGAL